MGSNNLPEIHGTVTIVNHEGTARVVYVVTVECISVVNHAATTTCALSGL